MAKTAPLQGITLVATFVSAGVANGAAGFIIVGGKPKKIDPHGPAFLKLTEAVRDLSAGGKGAKKGAKKTARS